jgi:hypothetical protein
MMRVGFPFPPGNQAVQTQPDSGKTGRMGHVDRRMQIDRRWSYDDIIAVFAGEWMVSGEWK